MTTFSDLDQLPYFGKEAATFLRAVGWLGRERPYRQGPTSPEVYNRLQKLLEKPFQPFVVAGFHKCELCQFEGEVTGGDNLFVPGDGVLFVCPKSILHYINAHGYKPPEVFCDAVLACPDTRSGEYKRLFLDNGGRILMRHVG